MLESDLEEATRVLAWAGLVEDTTELHKAKDCRRVPWGVLFFAGGLDLVRRDAVLG
jgi:hypothetical protein